MSLEDLFSESEKDPAALRGARCWVLGDTELFLAFWLFFCSDVFQKSLCTVQPDECACEMESTYT